MQPEPTYRFSTFRYIFCENLRQFGATTVKNYLIEINNRLNAIKERKRDEMEDILEIVPAEQMTSDENFFSYVKEHNEM